MLKGDCADSPILCLLNQLLIEVISQLRENKLSGIEGFLSQLTNTEKFKNGL